MVNYDVVSLMVETEDFTIPTYNKLPTGLDLFNRLRANRR